MGLVYHSHSSEFCLNKYLKQESFGKKLDHQPTFEISSQFFAKIED